jgi:MFS family permease
MPFSKQELTALKTIASLYLVRMTGLFMVLPVLSLYGQNLEGATPLLLGFALGVYGLAQAVLQIPFGMASDRFGRKSLLIIGFFLFIFGSVICANADSVHILILGRILQGAGAVSSVLLALVSDQISAQNRTTSMAVIGVTIGISFGISVIIGPLIASYLGGLSAIFYLNVVLGILALLMILLFVSEPAAESVTRTSRGSLRSVLIPDLLRLDLGIFSLHFMQMCIWVSVPGMLLGQLGIAVEKHWIIYLAAVGGGFIFMAPFMRMWDKRGQTRRAILVAISVCGISMLLMGAGKAQIVFLFGLFLFFWGFNLLEATLPSTVTKVASTANKGAATGVYSTCQFLGVFIGGVTGGWLVSVFDSSAVFYVSAVISLVWLLMMLPWKNFGSPDANSV